MTTNTLANNVEMIRCGTLTDKVRTRVFYSFDTYKVQVSKREEDSLDVIDGEEWRSPTWKTERTFNCNLKGRSRGETLVEAEELAKKIFEKRSRQA